MKSWNVKIWIYKDADFARFQAVDYEGVHDAMCPTTAVDRAFKKYRRAHRGMRLQIGSLRIVVQQLKGVVREKQDE